MTRADAQRNRERILAVAEEVFGRDEGASTEEIARRAGVGVGTVFRHFPTKADLLEAVFVAHLQRLRDHARGLLDAADAGTAFFDYFTHAVDDATAKLTIAGALIDAGADARSIAGTTAQEVRAATGDLLRRAQEAGAVRSDVHLPEVYGLLVGISRAGTAAPLDPATVASMIGIVFDGLRGPAEPTR